MHLTKKENRLLQQESAANLIFCNCPWHRTNKKFDEGTIIRICQKKQQLD